MPWRLEMDISLKLGHFYLDIQIDSASRALALVGPSGSGKSTCLRILAGLEPLARGRLNVAGEPWQDTRQHLFVPPWRRRVGWVPQEASLFPHHRVRENLAWSAPAPEDVERTAALLEMEHLLDRQPRRLSGGERQRVALGRALLSRPRLLLLDEPFAAVDRPLRSRLARAVADRCRQERIPLILVSHDDADVISLADEIWILTSGRLERAAGQALSREGDSR